MSRKKDKPGVLIYFDVREPLEVLNYEQRGQLFTAILDYSSEGIIPEFDDQVMRMAWAMIRPSVDRDDENYRNTVMKKTYASYCRVEKEAGREPLPFYEWSESLPDDQIDHHMTSCDVRRYQTKPTQLQPNPTTTQPNATTTQLQPNPTLIEFEDLWSLYPRKDGKKDAIRHYQRARKNGTTFEQVKAGILNYCEYLKREKVEQRFIMMGSTWFNGEHWNDEYKSNREPTLKDYAKTADFSAWGVK